MGENRMTFEEFVDEVMDRIKQRLPEEYRDASFSMEDVKKIDRSYRGLYIRKPNANTAIGINMDICYQDFMKGVPMDAILLAVAETVKLTPDHMKIPDIRNYDQAKENLFIQVWDKEAHDDFLKGVPFMEVDGLAATVHLFIGENIDGISSALVTNDMAEAMGVSKEQLYQDALENSAFLFPPAYHQMESIISRYIAMMGPEAREEDFNLNDLKRMVMLTTDQNLYGAAAMLYPAALEVPAEEMGSDLYIIPSSRHEVILMPVREVDDYHELEELLKMQNVVSLSPEDKLSDHIYRYDAKAKVLEKAQTYEERKAQIAGQKRAGQNHGHMRLTCKQGRIKVMIRTAPRTDKKVRGR